MTGTLSLSIELELGWGDVMKPKGRRFRQFEGRDRSGATRALERILEICDEVGVPVTFNVVGHLLQSSCDHEREPHADGWFSIDPDTNSSTDPLFYAPELVEKISTSKVDHEICTHTFSHIPVDTVSEKVLRWELNTVIKEHRDAGLTKPTTLVTPYNRQAPINVLRDVGITAVRVPQTRDLQKSAPRRFIWYLTRDPPTRSPTIVDGMTHIYTSVGPSLASFTLESGNCPPHPAFRILPKQLRVRAHKQYLRQALEAVCKGDDVHLWCHVWDLMADIQLSLVQKFLEDAGELSDRGDINVMSIENIDKRLRQER